MPAAMAPDLALPHAAYAKISPAPYLAAHLLPVDPAVDPIRPNGRRPDAFSPPTCHVGSLTNCAGSAVVRVGDTAVVCGVNAEILLVRNVPNPPHTYDPTNTTSATRRAHEELKSLGLIVPNVELATGCSPAHLPGGAPSNTAQTLASRLLLLTLSTRLLNVKDLQIKHTPPKHEGDEDEPVESVVAYWVLYPSVHVMSLAGESSLFDCAWAAMLAALRNVRLPRAWWDADIDNVLCSSNLGEGQRLNLRGLPIAATMGVFVAETHVVKALEERRGEKLSGNGKKLSTGARAWLLAEPDAYECSLCSESVTVVVDCSKPAATRIHRIEKSGGGVIGVAEMAQVTTAARRRWQEWKAVLP